jgi:hypothetical protein
LPDTAKAWIALKVYDAAIKAIDGHQRTANIGQTNMMAGKPRHPAKE